MEYLVMCKKWRSSVKHDKIKGLKGSVFEILYSRMLLSDVFIWI